MEIRAVLPQDLSIKASPTFAGLTIGTLSGILKGATGVVSAITDNSTNWDLAVAHISESGASHTYIDQAVTVAGTPTFAQLTVDNLRLDGNDIGLTTDTDLIQLAADTVTVNARLVIANLDAIPPQIHGSGGDLHITASGGNINFGNENLITTGYVETDKVIIIAPTVSDIEIGGYGPSSMYIKGLASGSGMFCNFFSADGDRSDSVVYRVFGYGTQGALDPTNSEYCYLAWISSTQQYEIAVKQVGDGVVRPLSIYTEGNSNQLFLATSGNIGIGTATPGYILDIDAGEIGNDNYDGLRIIDTGWKATSHPMLEFYNSHASFNGSLVRIYGEIGYLGINSKLYFAVADSSKNLQDRMVIDKDGNVGIGLTTVDANYKLIIRRAADVNFGIGLIGDELAIAAFNDALSANIPMRFYASEFNLLNGNVGINETAPQDKLEVNGTVLVKDKLKFTQDDGNEYIDSLADGYMDYRATTAHRFGDGTNQFLISNTGVVSLVGSAKRLLTERPDFDFSKITAQGKPTIVVLGAHTGFSLPVYAADEELFFVVNVPGRWDGVSDINVHILVALDQAATANDDFNLQLSWRNSREGSDPTTSVVLDNTTHDVTVETNIVDARKAQYNMFLIDFVVDYDTDVTILSHDLLSMRLRRLAAAGTEFAPGEIIVLDVHVDFIVDKMYKAPD